MNHNDQPRNAHDVMDLIDRLIAMGARIHRDQNAGWQASDTLMAVYLLIGSVAVAGSMIWMGVKF
jgi:hypothetical protein